MQAGLSIYYSRYIDTLYADESVLRRSDMDKTFKELLDEALEEIGMSPSRFGELYGRKYGFQGYYDLTSGKGRTKITPKSLAKIAEIVGKPVSYFVDPELTAKREAYIKDVFAQFMASETARETSPDILAIIEKIPFHGEKLPTKALYQRIAIAMSSGQFTDQQILNSAEENANPPPAPKRRIRS